DTIAAGRRIVITNPTFVASSDSKHNDIFWLNNFMAVFTRTINAFFVPDAVFYNGDQLFAPWQAASYIPFPTQPSGARALPAILIGKTNQQLLTLYGLAMGGILAPAALAGGPRTNGTISA